VSCRVRSISHNSQRYRYSWVQYHTQWYLLEDILWGEPERVHVQNMEQLHAHDRYENQIWQFTLSLLSILTPEVEPSCHRARCTLTTGHV